MLDRSRAQRGVAEVYQRNRKRLRPETHRHSLYARSHHIFVGQKPSIALSELVHEIKSSSTKFINQTRWVAGRFGWQEGFGAFSYSHSHIPTVARYIERQEEHHRRKTFREEYLQLLRKFQVPHDERYIFKEVA